MPFVLLFWWSCPLCCVSFPLGAVVGNGPLMLVTSGHCYWCLSFDALGCWAVFLSFGGCLLALGGFCPPGVFVFFPRLVALAFVLWRLSFCALGLLLSLVHLPSAASAHGLCGVLRFRSSSSSFSSSSSSFFSSFFLFFLFFGCLYSLWSPSCFLCLALPGVWPSLVLGLVGPS